MHVNRKTRGSNGAIAQKLVLGPKTFHQLSNIFTEDRIAGRNEAISKAWETGLGSSTL